MANTSDLVIRIPQSRLGCASWILAQTPDVAADVLEIACAAYNAVQREINVGELSKLSRASMRISQSSDDILLQAHQALELGSLEDDGCGCFIWRYTHPGCEEMRCCVAVTGSTRHTVKADVEKHHKKLQSALEAKHANCGLFISLAGRIPNMRSIELKMVTSETPIMYFSRDAMDDISDASLAVTAIRVMSQLGLTFNRQRRDGDIKPFTVDVAKIIDRLLSQMDSLDQQILASGQLQKNLLDIREGIVHDIMAMGSSRPVSSLCMEAPLSSDTSQEKLATPLLLRPEAGQVVQLVLSYRTSKRRNPTNYDVLRPLGDLATFTQSLVEQNISVMHFIGEALKIEAAEKAAEKAAAVVRTPELEIRVEDTEIPEADGHASGVSVVEHVVHKVERVVEPAPKRARKSRVVT